MKKIQAIEIVEARILNDYVVELVFSDLRKGTVNLRGFLGHGIFKSLLNKSHFRKMVVDGELGTICWPNGADIAPDTLYYEAFSSDK